MFFSCSFSLSLRWIGNAALPLLLACLSAGAWALPSACTATWGTSGTTLRYYNTASSQWVNTVSLGVSGNALAGSEQDGALYYVSAVDPPATMYRASFDNVQGTVTVAQVSAAQISVPAAMTYTDNTGQQRTVGLPGLVGASMDRDITHRRMFLYATSGEPTVSLPVNGTNTGNVIAMIGLLDPEAPGAVSWSVLYQTSATGTITYPLLGSSGDIFADQQSGAVWVVTNSTPARILRIGLNYSGYALHSAQVTGTATIQLGGTPLSASVGAVAISPYNGAVYMSSSGLNSTWALADHTTSSPSATLVTNSSGASDAGNCVAPPDPPALLKSFNPVTATAPGLTTLTLVLGNPNKAPIWTTVALQDTLPSGMLIANAPGIAANCFSNGAAATRPASTTLTAAAGAGSLTVPVGAMIPGGSTSGGSCSFSVQVSATVATFYANTLAAGSLQTTVGSNAADSTATFRLQSSALPNAPTIAKSFNPTTATGAVGTTTLTIVINNPNTSTNTLTASLIDALGANLRISTPSLLTVTCFSNGVATTRVSATTATTTSNAITIPGGAPIPGGASTGGSCSFSLRLTATTASFNLNTIAAGGLDTVSGSNLHAATAGFYLGVSDFSVVKSQRVGANGATTTGVLDVPSGNTLSYVIQIRNGGGIAGTRTFSDSLPLLITPTLSLATTTFLSSGCRAVTATVSGATVVSGTVSAAPTGGGCDITVVARASATSSIVSVINSVGIYTVTGAVDSSLANNTSSVTLNIKPSVNLTVTKTDGKTTVTAGGTNSYIITVANGGPSAADGAVLRDPQASGLNCTSISCSETGGAACPLPTQLFVSSLQSGTGLSIPVLPSNSSVSFVLTCAVTATGLP
ncbi:MAG: hypothetical protein Q8K31_03825 [Burkholderiaceae bacterium]|nr:hypothetical protein [Burkholderiaceae bacterium]MDP1968300.1 hypothetical protein [Burkholderiaceae bacterium]